MDSGRHKKKDYTHIKSVLNDALTGYAFNGGIVKKKNLKQGNLVFGHKTDFLCATKAENSMREADYAIMHMREWFVRDEDTLGRIQRMSEYTDQELMHEFGRIQRMITRIIHRDISSTDGLFYHGLPIPPNREIESRLEAQGEDRPFNSLEGFRPFPPKPKPKPSKKQ